MISNISDSFKQDLWVHVGGLIAIAIGLLGDRYLNLNLGATTSLIFIIGGLAVLGVKITNGTAGKITNASVAAAQIVADAVAVAAAKAVNETAVAAAQVVKDTAVAAKPTVPPTP